jgi:hypothetical protein
MALFQNIFPQQKTNLITLLGVIMILNYKHQPKMNGVYLMNPFTKKNIDQFTGLPITPTTTTTTPTTTTTTPAAKTTPAATTTTPAAVASKNTATPTAKSVTTPETKIPCSTYDGKRDECIRHKYKRNCEYIHNENKNTYYCRQMKK